MGQEVSRPDTLPPLPRPACHWESGQSQMPGVTPSRHHASFRDGMRAFASFPEDIFTFLPPPAAHE